MNQVEGQNQYLRADQLNESIVRVSPHQVCSVESANSGPQGGLYLETHPLRILRGDLLFWGLTIRMNDRMLNSTGRIFTNISIVSTIYINIININVITTIIH
eukprot:GHVN01067649.1.p1 GENE.GHVN01067649.1~~GHVN01067649.1.p1  ORF type:complete len:102 (-),score=5.99 GHVN01067649.1:7-312(-)